MTSTIVSELQAATKVQVRDEDTPETFTKRLVQKANDLTDDKWETLAEPVQVWVNDAIEALRQKKPLPVLEGVEALFEEEEDAGEEEQPGSEETGDPVDDLEDDAEEEEAPAPKKEAAPPAAKKQAAKAKPAAKPAKTAKKKQAEAATGRRGKFPEGAKIKIVPDANPFREGTKCFEWFGKIEDGMTIPEAVEAGTPRNHIRWAHSLGHLKIG